MERWDRSTVTRCGHCRKDTESGTHNGCVECGRVKHTVNGKREKLWDRQSSDSR